MKITQQQRKPQNKFPDKVEVFLQKTEQKEKEMKTRREKKIRERVQETQHLINRSCRNRSKENLWDKRINGKNSKNFPSFLVHKFQIGRVPQVSIIMGDNRPMTRHITTGVKKKRYIYISIYICIYI